MLYLGKSNEPLQLMLNGSAYKLYIGTEVINKAYLLSSDGFILQDTNGLYLTIIGSFIKLLSSDNYVLQDTNELYLTVKEDK